ncbi:MAG: hypothetical protein ABH875_01165 [Candidatus Omnitrophota bacterium]
MGRKKQFKVKTQQKIKRRKRLQKLKAKGADIGTYFHEGHYVGPHRGK